MYNKIVEVIEIKQTPSKYFWLGMDRMNENMTSTAIFIVKGFVKYLFKNC